jgi:hypothetical protein
MGRDADGVEAARLRKRGALRIPLGQRFAQVAPLRRSCSLGDLLRAQIGHPERAEELPLATDASLVLPFRGRATLTRHLFQRFKLGLAGCFASRRALRLQLLPVGGVISSAASTIASLAVRPAPTRLAGVDAEVGFRRHNTAARTRSRVANHQSLSGAKM